MNEPKQKASTDPDRLGVYVDDVGDEGSYVLDLHLMYRLPPGSSRSAHEAVKLVAQYLLDIEVEHRELGKDHCSIERAFEDALSRGFNVHYRARVVRADQFM